MRSHTISRLVKIKAKVKNAQLDWALQSVEPADLIDDLAFACDLLTTQQAALANALRVLRLCRSALYEEVNAAGNLDHPTIQAHANAAIQADDAIAKAEGV